MVLFTSFLKKWIIKSSFTLDTINIRIDPDEYSDHCTIYMCLNLLRKQTYQDCKDSKFIYPAAGHIMTGNLKIISDSRIRYIVSKGPKYRFPSRIDFKTCREEIASALNDFGNRWCKREYVEPNALKEWKVRFSK